jgi:hypothetical protein
LPLLAGTVQAQNWPINRSPLIVPFAHVTVEKSPDIIKKLADFGAEPGGIPPAQFADFIREEIDKWIGLAKKANISAD